MYQSNIPRMEFNFSSESPIPGMPPIRVERSIDMGFRDNYQAQINFSQLLFASGQVYYAHRSVERQLRAGEHQIDAARIKVARSVAEAYLSVLISQSVAEAQREARIWNAAQVLLGLPVELQRKATDLAAQMRQAQEVGV